MALLKINALTKYYKETLALSEIDLTLREGELVSVIGPSGSGKSTLLRCINRMIEPSSGEVIFDHYDILKLPRRSLRKVRTRIGMIFQHYNLVNRLTVLENVLHGRLGYKSTFDGVIGNYTPHEKHLALDILHKLGLEDHLYQRCDSLSGGQKQRVGIARALIQEPRLILCDEPIASLDPGSSKIIMDTLRKICRETGISVLVNLHQVDVARKYSDRIIGLNSGRIVFEGKAEKLEKKTILSIYGAQAGELILD